ncbi:MAG: hypothetical protein ACREGR_03100, partial [Minisyncoccia bacterium]
MAALGFTVLSGGSIGWYHYSKTAQGEGTLGYAEAYCDTPESGATAIVAERTSPNWDNFSADIQMIPGCHQERVLVENSRPDQVIHGVQVYSGIIEPNGSSMKRR